MTEIATRPAVPTTAGALRGIRVVEVGFAAAGPLVGKYLANFGAEVIRLESRLAADVFRTTYPPFKDGIVEPDHAGMFAFYNDGKRSATVNLKHPKGVALARALIGTADVFVESFTPGTVARLGLGAESLRADRPGLIVLSSCNQGQTGPRRGWLRCDRGARGARAAQAHWCGLHDRPLAVRGGTAVPHAHDPRVRRERPNTWSTRKRRRRRRAAWRVPLRGPGPLGRAQRLERRGVAGAA